MIIGSPKLLIKIKISLFVFESSENFVIRSDFNVNPKVFLLKELERGFFWGCDGLVKDYDRFNQL